MIKQTKKDKFIFDPFISLIRPNEVSYAEKDKLIYYPFISLINEVSYTGIEN